MAKHAYNLKAADRLWEVSEALTHVRFQFN